jgi:hypothetical protein
MFNNIFFFSKILRLRDKLEKSCRAEQATWQYSARALHAGYLSLQKHTTNMS